MRLVPGHLPILIQSLPLTKFQAMPAKGQILVDSSTGDTYEFLETTSETQGARCTFKSTTHRKGLLVPDHFHLLQDETFEVISGELTILSDGATRKLKSGEKITLPRNQPHNHYNKSDEPLTYIQTVSPALDFEYLVENLVGLSADGKRKGDGFGLMQELVSLRYLDSKAFLAGPPVWLQKIMMNLLAPIGRLLGYRAVYAKYSGIEK